MVLFESGERAAPSEANDIKSVTFGGFWLEEHPKLARSGLPINTDTAMRERTIAMSFTHALIPCS
jgi:hypothetical protein